MTYKERWGHERRPHVLKVSNPKNIRRISALKQELKQAAAYDGFLSLSFIEKKRLHTERAAILQSLVRT